jgi:hypothetical protein
VDGYGCACGVRMEVGGGGGWGRGSMRGVDDSIQRVNVCSVRSNVRDVLRVKSVSLWLFLRKGRLYG